MTRKIIINRSTEVTDKVLWDGELCFIKDSDYFVVGDGKTPLKELKPFNNIVAGDDNKIYAVTVDKNGIPHAKPTVLVSKDKGIIGQLMVDEPDCNLPEDEHKYKATGIFSHYNRIEKIDDKFYALHFTCDNSAPCGNCALFNNAALDDLCKHPDKEKRKCKHTQGSTKGWNTWEYVWIPDSNIIENKD